MSELKWNTYHFGYAMGLLVCAIWNTFQFNFSNMFFATFILSISLTSLLIVIEDLEEGK